MMLRQIKILTGRRLHSVLGVNEFLHTKDKSKKRRFLLLTLVWAVLVCMLEGYLVLFASGMIKLGLGEALLVYLYGGVSLLVLVFTLFRGGNILLDIKTFEMEAAFPVSHSAIVASRFLVMYAEDFLISLGVMLTGTAVYGYYLCPGIFFYMKALFGTILLPLIPLAAGSILGVLVKAASSRSRHRSLGEAVLLLFVLLAGMGGSSFLANSGKPSMEALADFAYTVRGMIGRLYPPALWFGNMLDGDVGAFVILTGVSVFLTFLLEIILQKKLLPLCSALVSTSTRQNFKMKSLEASSPLIALWRREMQRYFACPTYMVNTAAGYVLMVFVSGVLLVSGTEKLEIIFEMPGITLQMFPLLLSIMGSFTSTTACSISMEGKNWWLVKSLPVRSKVVYDSKILLNLTIAAPFYLISVLLSCAAIRPKAADALWIILLPVLYIVFSSVAGLTVNLALPVLNWENEVQVVKQSASTLIAMLVSIGAVLVPLMAMFFLKGVSANLILGITAIAIVFLTILLYDRNQKKDMITI